MAADDDERAFFHCERAVSYTHLDVYKRQGSLRLTLNEEITMEQIDFTVESIKKIVARLRAMSPLYEDYMKKQASAHA